MLISRIGAVSARTFGMAKGEFYERKKFWHNVEAGKTRPGSDAWFAHKQKMRDIITDQLAHDPDLTPGERADLERDRYLLDTDMYNKRNGIY